MSNQFDVHWHQVKKNVDSSKAVSEGNIDAGENHDKLLHQFVLHSPQLRNGNRMYCLQFFIMLMFAFFVLNYVTYL